MEKIAVGGENISVGSERVSSGTAKNLGAATTSSMKLGGVSAVIRQGASIIDRPHPNMSDAEFREIHGQDKINQDKAYVARMKGRFEGDPDEGRLAKAFEDLFIDGVTIGSWLGEESINGIKFVSSAPTTQYDDYRHRVDAYASVFYLGKDQRPQRRTIGADVTISGSRKTIMDKLTRMNNDDTESPFGFSSVDYYSNGKHFSKVEMLPRYVIGVSGIDVRDILQTIPNDGSGRRRFNLNTAKNVKNHFKVLSEIYSENQLYMAMLPSDVETANPVKLKSARGVLSFMNARVGKALELTAKDLVRHKYVNLDSPDSMDPKALVLAVQKKLLAESHQYYEDEEKERELKFGPREKSNDDSFDDTYVQIMTCCAELKQAAADGKLDQYKRSMPRNKSFSV